MDLKLRSIAWVGNSISQKFETMCREVDTIVSQDTVRYVENQMQTMGDSVKKFCSDVVQDFLPRFVDPVKHEAQEVALKKNTAIGTYFKSIIGLHENPIDVISKSDVEPNSVDPVAHQMGNEFTGLHFGNQIITSISENPSVRLDSDFDLRQIDDVIAHQVYDVTKEEDSLKESSSTSGVSVSSASWVLKSISLGEKDPSKASLICEFADCDHRNAQLYDRAFICNFSLSCGVPGCPEKELSV